MGFFFNSSDDNDMQPGQPEGVAPTSALVQDDNGGWMRVFPILLGSDFEDAT